MTISATKNAKILLVDDDAPIRNLLYRFLNQQYEVQFAADGKTALEIFEEFNPVLVILDWNLPDTTGLKLCQEMQKRTNVLVAILSNRTALEDRINILKAGADDFISKPFSLEELAVRVEVLLRRARSVIPRQLVFDRLEIDLVGREVRFHDRILTLTNLEYEILCFLAIHSGESWSRKQLIEKIWGWKTSYASEERLVDVHIGHIRKKMAQIDKAVPRFIQTIRGYGYTFAPLDRHDRVVSN
ncbi:MAG: response regulator transcription factor [Oscillatoriales cyanobacterium RU_3_3]|nr:response regulator transcription factor [Microcoleus sp. SU_5_6]NJL68893.1 response regulator transcription factor [Microcoleus sp. SM1_3_4]NJM59516.1 response regulator transcription factor [Oscillatoriales cyanobacterium RU_3_3]